ncbi:MULTISPECIES: RiPP maturation radical SAM C-methyltransferase [Streptomyces]|uniref:RiPP maturation radical SAM C-methyltransferase n=1 Tax=Streptomyces eurythermus TaxID=42237 RepID=A0ABW6YQB8_9ACTN|nr:MULTISPECIES: RiPP maturation radical SAM C-methyltransferase [Streptomyces]
MQIGHTQPVPDLTPPVVHEDALSVALVCMPWAVVDMPSLALSTIAPLFERRGEVEKLDVVYGNIRWLDHLVREAGLEGGHYELIVDAEVFGVGEWVFSSCFRPGVDPRHTSFYDLVRDSEHVDAYCAMFRAAPAFIDELARDLVASGVDVLGLTSTFDQNIASFALAHRVKELRPDIVTILGGANCDGVQGTAVHRARPEFDYVIRGEAEHSIAPLIAHIAECRSGDGKKDDGPLHAVPGLCWRSDADGATVSNPIGRTPVSMNVVPEPTYDHYFRDLGKSPAAPFIDVKIPLEASRGCWWGAKHHCTFCGLNGSAMTHRAKPAERVQAEASRAIRRHNVLDLVFSDNILAPEHVVQLTTDLALPAEWDVRLFAEVKSNLNFSQLESLARAGFTQLQPGVESLCTPILRIMRKGVTGWQNVRFLRDCATCRIYPSWNILLGFPGEQDSDYEALIDSLPALHHLTPPAGAFPIKLERFSPYFDDPALGLQALGPSLNLVSAYEGVADGLDDLVYVFESEPAGLSPETGELLREAVANWKATASVSRLVALPAPDDSLVVVDDRPAWPSRELVLRPGLEAEAYRALAKGRTLPALASAMRSLGIAVREGRLEELVENWTELGIVFHEDSTHLALATGLRW